MFICFRNKALYEMLWTYFSISLFTEHDSFDLMLINGFKYISEVKMAGIVYVNLYE